MVIYFLLRFTSATIKKIRTGNPSVAKNKGITNLEFNELIIIHM